MTENLSAMTTQTTTPSDVLLETISGMMCAVNRHSAVAIEQGSAVDETISTLEEIRAISAQTQQKAESLGNSAECTQSEGEKGMLAVEQTAVGMESIREKVEGIAENILALSKQIKRIGETASTVKISHIN